MTMAAKQVVLDRAQVEERSTERVQEGPGVHRALLWVEGGSTAGLMWVEPDARMDEHVHHGHAHHVWVIEGTPKVLGRELQAGSYAFVPPGVPHSLEGGPEGCQLFYLYLAVDDVS
ncbi:MAG: cupin domain-containing protein [Nitriliruptorales bacterium]|nr:cupin domain-containing protein [Nitriliruptorales bacterium]